MSHRPSIRKAWKIPAGLLVLATAGLAGDLPPGLLWRADRFGKWDQIEYAGGIHGGSERARIEQLHAEELLHVVNEGTEPGDWILLVRPWNANPEAGASVEARVRVVAGRGAGGVMIGVADGVHEDRLTFYPDGIELEHARLRHAMDTTDGFHVYRVDIKGLDIRVSVDGRDVLYGPANFTKPAQRGRNRVSYGSESSAATGEAFWDWVRHTRPRPPPRPGERTLPEIEHHIVYKDPDRYAPFPKLFIDPANEHLYAEFTAKAHASHYHAQGDRGVRRESRDGGQTWRDVESLPETARRVRPDPAYPAADGGLIRIVERGWQWLPEARLPEFEGRHRITPGREDQGRPGHFGVIFGGYAERSEDGGATWQRTEIPGLQVYTSRSSPWSYAQLPDGTVLRAFVVQEAEDQGRRVVAAMTRDGKQTEVVRVMGGEPGGPLTFTEETLVRATREGAVWMLTRVHGGGDYLWQAVSHDGGRTWTARRSEINVSRSPPSGLVELEDGRLLLVMGYRRLPFGIRALVSEDEGLSWRMDHEFVLRDDGDGPDLGYPEAVQLADGTVVAMYYFHTDDKVRHIACSRFRVPPLE